MNYAWPQASYADREIIFQEHVSYQQGFMYFLANDPRVPEKIRNQVAAYGLSKENFPETDGWPHQLYVREARRMVGEYVMAESNCRSTVVADDSIGLAEYNMDSHNVQRFVRHEGNQAWRKTRETCRSRVPHPYPVSFRAILPKESECTNLLVPVCLSSTHIAYGSIRMEPVFMVLGQSAATAACLAIDEGITVQKTPYTKLRDRLLQDRQNLSWTGKISMEKKPTTKHAEKP